MNVFLLDVFSFVILKFLQQILRLIPDRGKKALGTILGRIGYYVLRERRKVAIENMRRAFKSLSDEELKRCAKRVFENLGINLVECLFFPYLKESEYEKRFKVKVEDGAAEALHARGAIALGFHFSNWEITGVLSKLLKREIVAIAKPLKGFRLLGRFVNQLRSKTGLSVISNKEAVGEVVKFVRDGKIVAILADQREKRSKCVYVDFFGEKVPTSKSVPLIALRTKAPVIPIYSIREGFLNYTIVLSHPIEIRRNGHLSSVILENARKVNGFLETLIRTFPEEWFWVHRRWARKKVTEP